MELEHCPTTTLRVEHVGELLGSNLDSWRLFLLDEVILRKMRQNTPKSTTLPLNWALNLAASTNVLGVLCKLNKGFYCQLFNAFFDDDVNTNYSRKSETAGSNLT